MLIKSFPNWFPNSKRSSSNVITRIHLKVFWVFSRPSPVPVIASLQNESLVTGKYGGIHCHHLQVDARWWWKGVHGWIDIFVFVGETLSERLYCDAGWMCVQRQTFDNPFRWWMSSVCVRTYVGRYMANVFSSSFFFLGTINEAHL